MRQICSRLIVLQFGYFEDSVITYPLAVKGTLLEKVVSFLPASLSGADFDLI